MVAFPAAKDHLSIKRWTLRTSLHLRSLTSCSVMCTPKNQVGFHSPMSALVSAMTAKTNYFVNSAFEQCIVNPLLVKRRTSAPREYVIAVSIPDLSLHPPEGRNADSSICLT